MRWFFLVGLLFAVDTKSPDNDTPPSQRVTLVDYQPEPRACAVAAGGRSAGDLGVGLLAASAIMLGRHVRRGRQRR